MHVSRFFKWYFLGLLGLGAKRVIEEQAESRARRGRYHGYTLEQMSDVVRCCYENDHAFRDRVSELDEESRQKELFGLFTMPPDRFKRQFGFDRPSAR
jgi:hypothetical protein